MVLVYNEKYYKVSVIFNIIHAESAVISSESVRCEHGKFKRIMYYDQGMVQDDLCPIFILLYIVIVKLSAELCFTIWTSIYMD